MEKNPVATTSPAPGVDTQQSQVYVTPIASLGQGSSTILCPSCHRTANTRTEKQLSNQGWMWAGFLCLCGCWLCAWIPCVMDDNKDTKQFCSCCGVMLAVVKKDGVVQLTGAAHGGPQAVNAPVV